MVLRTCGGRSGVVLWGTTRKSSSWKMQEIFVKPATVFDGSMFLWCYVGHADDGKAELCLMLCPDRDTLLDMSARYLWVQWVSGSMV